jgi:hypothetical protein
MFLVLIFERRKNESSWSPSSSQGENSHQIARQEGISGTDNAAVASSIILLDDLSPPNKWLKKLVSLLQISYYY